MSDQIEQLRRENNDLRQEVVELKVHQFYHFDDRKLKELILEVERLRDELKTNKEELVGLRL